MYYRNLIYIYRKFDVQTSQYSLGERERWEKEGRGRPYAEMGIQAFMFSGVH